MKSCRLSAILNKNCIIIYTATLRALQKPSDDFGGFFCFTDSFLFADVFKCMGDCNDETYFCIFSDSADVICRCFRLRKF